MTNEADPVLEELRNNKSYADLLDFSGDIYKLKRDKSIYKQRVLSNGLRVVFIEDRSIVSSNITMNIKVGSNQNPPEYLGLAHFLEHMLFMGSSKYPDSDHYGRAIASNKGMSNAYTASSNTAYYFNCPPDLLFNIADVFCNFFVEPLFDESYVSKEITAVNNEHQKNVPSDGYRAHILGDYFTLDSVNSKFGTGNTETLRKPNIMAALKEFYKKYYTIDRMLLVVIHNKIDDIFEQKIAGIFSEIRNHNADKTNKTNKTNKPHRDAFFERYPFKLKDMAPDTVELIAFEKQSPGCMLKIRIFVPDTMYGVKIPSTSFFILSYILDHRGTNSLYNILSKTNLIREFYVDISTYTADTCIDILAILTDEGVGSYHHIVYAIMSYINILGANPAKIFDTYYDEIKKLRLIDIITSSKRSAISTGNIIIDSFNSFDTHNADLSYALLFDYGLIGNTTQIKEHFVRTVKYICEYGTSCMKIVYAIDTDFDKLDSVKRIIYGDASKTGDNKNKKIKIQTDKFYKVKYIHTETKLDPRILRSYAEFKYVLPELNPYIINNIHELKIISPHKKDKHDKTKKIKRRKIQISGSTIKLDRPDDYIKLKSHNHYFLTKYNTYKTYHTSGKFHVLLSSQSDKINVVHYVLMLIYVKLVAKKHTAELYLGSEAGNIIEIAITGRGLNLYFSCYDATTMPILSDFLNWIYKSKLDIDTDEYHKIYVSLKEYYASANFDDTANRLEPYLNEVLDPSNTITNDQIIYTLQQFDPAIMAIESDTELCFKTLQQKAIHLMSVGEIRGVLAGSIVQSTAQDITDLLDSTIKHADEFKIRHIDSVTDQTASTNSDNSNNSGNSNNSDNSADSVESVFIKRNINTEDPNTGILYGLYLGEYMYSTATQIELHKNLCFVVLEGIIFQHVFNIIRTEKQLAYYVRAKVISVENSGTWNLFLIFESMSQDPDILSIVRDYVDSNLMDAVNSVTESQLQNAKDGVALSMFREFKNTDDKLRIASHILNNMTYDEISQIGSDKFLNRLYFLDEYAALQKITLKDVQAFYKDAVSSAPRYAFIIKPHDDMTAR